MRKISCLLPIILFAYSCKLQSQNDRIISTAEKIIESIKDSNFNNFRNLFGVDLRSMGKDENMVSGDFRQCCRLYKYYSKGFKTKSVTDNNINELGQKKVSVIFFDGNDSINNIKEFGIDLFFGPPNLFSLEKISGYKILFERNTNLNLIVAPVKQQ